MQDARLLVIRCVEAAAAAGEVAIVGHLLTNTFPALDTLALVAAAESALTLAASFIRLDVARAVLEGPAAARLPAEDIAFIVRSIHGSDNFIAHAAPELFRYLALTLTRLSQDA
ncbi:hypothetical protein HK405_010153 [Cladochytrium tenue]|nr:hypothetical protein HK405_010153 [Cladochytrium tenue]